MPNIDLGEAQKALMNDPLWAARGKAIQAYATLEQSLASLLAFLSDTDPVVAATIFFKVSSADSRCKILEKLFRRKFQDRYNLFRNTLFDQLRPTDHERNSIVHWNAVAAFDGGTQASLELRPPDSENLRYSCFLPALLPTHPTHSRVAPPTCRRRQSPTSLHS
jgi:hypothetical protein